MTNKKEKTIKEYLNEILANYPLSEEHSTFIKGRIEALEKKTANRKLSASQIRNRQVADEVLEYMRDTCEKLTVSEMLKRVPAFNAIPDISHAYANHIVKVLKDEGNLIRTEDKGKAYFQAS